MDKTEDLLSPLDVADVAEKFETDETVEKVEKVEKLRSSEGQEEMAGVGEMEGDGDPERNISGEWSLSWSSMSSGVAFFRLYQRGNQVK